MKFAWAMTNAADFDFKQFKNLFDVVGIVFPSHFSSLDQDRIEQCNYLSQTISSQIDWESKRETLCAIVKKLAEDNPQTFLAKRVGPCFGNARCWFENTWHVGNGGRVSVTDIPDSCWSGWVYAPRLPGAKGRTAKIWIPMKPRQAHY